MNKILNTMFARISHTDLKKEAEAHYYNPTYQGLQDIGVKPHLLDEETMEKMFRIVEKYKGNIRKDVIFKGVKWS